MAQTSTSTATAAATTTTTVTTDVLIVGGGGCGLTLSSMLADYGVDHYLVERRSGTSKLPKAHYLNQRAMEALRQHGMVDEILEKGAPSRNFSRALWRTSLGGSGPLDRRTIHQLNSFGGDDGSPTSQIYFRDAPLRSNNLPQIRLEPILRRLAEKRNPGRILFSHNVIDFTDDGDRVSATVKDEDGHEIIYKAKYMVAADGGKSIGPRIGVVMDGPTDIADMVSTHFSADLSEYWDDKWFACHFINGDGGTVLESGAVVPMGPTWGRKSQEWVCHFGFDVEDKQRYDESKLIPRIRNLLKIPDLDLKVHTINHWIIERVLANKFREGRIFIAGDAAHRHPPTTGLGLNTAIEDANNLSWKLAWVLQGKADAALLDTYDAERRAVGKRNCDWGLFTFVNTTVINAAIGLIKGDKEGNRKKFEALFEDSESGRTFLAQTKRITESQNVEFSAHDLELGFRYDTGFHIPDGTAPPETDPLGQTYIPTTRPGHRLPHAWLEDQDGQILSTHDLVAKHGYGRFLVITDNQGDAWLQAAAEVAKAHGIPIETAQIGQNSQYVDRDDNWEKNRGIGPGGVILVRPDNFVSWRSVGKTNRQGKELVDAVNQLFAFTKPITLTNGQVNGNGTNGANGLGAKHETDGHGDGDGTPAVGYKLAEMEPTRHV
ncbi:2,4-dichlorophenol 6-monooxygenase [Capronia epimyces CBS 606.96]|uniref:2,4-dichlorophenol 6-monooxygenase n=1 Tax=Capronia epimyces CBS 606.96 TaxID=1182542 RepID=W9XQA9_9EURO|nr:2,4-dichlorophenol 6-monooxygenase [Capronia epimyces CBS 606.96]EXJ79171.1 2,4-dichlorophenol 6-monooxygenase [Capronia epimyces CBS 606.96]